MEQKSKKWPHQENHRRGHPELSAGNHGNQRLNHVHRVTIRKEKDAGHQTSVSRHDHQKRKSPSGSAPLFAMNFCFKDLTN